MTTPRLGLLVAVLLVVSAQPDLATPRRILGTTHRQPGQIAFRTLAQRWLTRLQRHRTAARRDAQLPDLLERIASGLRAGLALGPALIAAAHGSPNPIAAELNPLADALRQGAPLEAELECWGRSPTSSPDVRLVTAALDLSRQAGGATSRTVDRVAATLRERRELHAEARALATQARASAAVLAVAPLLFTALVATIEPSAASVLVATPIGLLCLAAGLALQAAGAAWMTRIVRSPW